MGGLYDVIVYHADDFVSELVTVNGVSASDYTGTLAHPNYADAFDGLLNSDFWYFSSVPIDNNEQPIISVGGTDGVGEGAFNTLTGVQIIEIQLAANTPEPSALMLVLIGLVGLTAAHRRRRQ